MQDYQFFTLIGLMAAGFGWMFVLYIDLKKELSQFKLENKTDHATMLIENQHEHHEIRQQISEFKLSNEKRLTQIETWIAALEIFKRSGTEK